MGQPASEPTLRDYFAVVFRRKFTVLFVAIATAGIIAWGAYAIPPSFTAQASLIVKAGREFVYRPEVGEAGRAVRFSVEEMVNSEAEILGSRDLAARVVDEIGADTLYPELLEKDFPAELRVQKSIAKLNDAFAIVPVVDSSIIRVAFEHGDPKLAARAVNLLIDRFKEKHLEIFSDSTAAFLDAQLKKYQTELTDAEEALEEFKKSREIHELSAQRNLLLTQRLGLEQQRIDTDVRLSELRGKFIFLNAGNEDASPEDTRLPARVAPEKKTFLVAQWSELQNMLNEVELKITAAERKLARFKKRRKTSDNVFPSHPGIKGVGSLDEASMRLLDLRLKEKELLRTYDKDTRQVRGILKEIKLVEDFMETRGKKIEKIIGAEIIDELSTLKKQRRDISKSVEALDEQIQSFGLQEILEDLAPIEAKRAKILMEVARLGKDLRSLDESEKELRKLKRGVMLSERNFQTYLNKSEEARVSAELDKQKRINIKVVQSAFPPVAPGGLSKNMKVILGIFVGLVAGVCVALFFELISPPRHQNAPATR
jgi:uncharacterized protein involved in exopolysaccharide biosynthesis